MQEKDGPNKKIDIVCTVRKYIEIKTLLVLQVYSLLLFTSHGTIAYIDGSRAVVV